MRRRAHSADGGTATCQARRPRVSTAAAAAAGITYVTAYFTVQGSKHATAAYAVWAERLLRTLHAPLLIYTEPAHVQALTAARAALPPEWTELVVYERGLAQHPLLDEHGMDTWTAQRAQDPEAARHGSAWLYVLWNGKAWLVEDAIRRAPFRVAADGTVTRRAAGGGGTDTGTGTTTPYFAWVDIGLLREDSIATRVASVSPATQVRPHIAAALRHRMALLNIDAFKGAELGGARLEDAYTHLQTLDRVGGGVMAGHADAWAAWLVAYRATLRRLLARGYFVGKDQTVMAVTAVDTDPSIVLFLQPRRVLSTLEAEDGGGGAAINAAWSYLLLWLLGMPHSQLGTLEAAEPMLRVSS